MGHKNKSKEPDWVSIRRGTETSKVYSLLWAFSMAILLQMSSYRSLKYLSWISELAKPLPQLLHTLCVRLRKFLKLPIIIVELTRPMVVLLSTAEGGERRCKVEWPGVLHRAYAAYKPAVAMHSHDYKSNWERIMYAYQSVK
jgi:hypothetical protein